jgi:hypothetical protein
MYSAALVRLQSHIGGSTKMVRPCTSSICVQASLVLDALDP